MIVIIVLQIQAGPENWTGMHCSGIQFAQNDRVPSCPGRLLHKMFWQR